MDRGKEEEGKGKKKQVERKKKNMVSNNFKCLIWQSYSRHKIPEQNDQTDFQCQ